MKYQRISSTHLRVTDPAAIARLGTRQGIEFQEYLGKRGVFFLDFQADALPIVADGEATRLFLKRVSRYIKGRGIIQFELFDSDQDPKVIRVFFLISRNKVSFSTLDHLERFLIDHPRPSRLGLWESIENY